MKREGDLIIKRGDTSDYSQITEVTGYVSVYGDAKLEAPNLTTVGGYVSVYGDVKLEALTTVGGDVYVHGDAKLEAPNLTTVGGYVSVYGDVKLEAPSLTTVGGYVYVYGDVKLEALTTVGGDVYVYGDAKLEAPNLTTVGGYVSVHGDAKLEAPNLVNKDNPDAKRTAYKALTDSFAKYGLIKVDGILSWIDGQKTIGDITVYETRIVGKREASYIVKRGETYSHGETVEKAIEDLRYKIADRDVSQYAHWKGDLKQEITLDEAIQGYRVITGACEYGTKDFVSRLGELPEKITIEEVMLRTQNAFGHEALRGFLR